MNGCITKETAEKLFHEYSNYVFRVAFFLTRSKELADDITQEVFIKAFLKYSSYDESKPFEPWIYKITINTARNMFRQKKAVILSQEAWDEASPDSIEDEMVEREARNTLWQAINRLNLQSREVIVLHYYCGLTLKEIASVLGIPQGTCKSRLNNALKKLKQKIAQDEIRVRKGDNLYERIR